MKKQETGRQGQPDEIAERDVSSSASGISATQPSTSALPFIISDPLLSTHTMTEMVTTTVTSLPSVLSFPAPSFNRQPSTTSATTQLRSLSPSKSESKIVPVEGDNHCAFYAFGIGLIENIFHKTLLLNPTDHESFLRIFGQHVLKLDREATVPEIETWINTHYKNRYDFGIYSQLNLPLRMLTSALVREQWSVLAEKMLGDLTAMVAQARDSRQSNRLDVASFETIFRASYLKEGQFGIALRKMLDAVSHSIGSSEWQQSFNIWFAHSNIRELYIDSIVKTLWASKEIELPLLAQYFGATLSVGDETIHQAAGKVVIGLTMPKGTHYDYQRKIVIPEGVEDKKPVSAQPKMKIKKSTSKEKRKQPASGFELSSSSSSSSETPILQRREEKSDRLSSSEGYPLPALTPSVSFPGQSMEILKENLLEMKTPKEGGSVKSPALRTDFSEQKKTSVLASVASLMDKSLLARIQANDAKLTSVDVSDSQLTLVTLKELVDALKQNTHVRRLNVSGNALGDQGVELLAIPDLPFTSLVAGECQMTDVNALAKNERLIELLLPSNQINAAGLIFFAQNKTLQVLSLAGNDLTDESAEVLAKNRGLSSLILSHNKVRVKGAQALALNKTLKQLDLNYNAIQAEGAVALAQNTHLTSLMLASNAITPIGVSAFADNRGLTELDMSYNHVDDTGAAALAKHPALIRLHLDHNQITYEGAYALSQMTRLTSLTICHNLLKDPGVAALAQIKTLQYLDVAGNRVGVEGAHILALNTSLSTLILSTNLVGDVGAVLLARNHHLSTLLLSYNNIGDPGAVALAGNKKLKVLNLNYNRIGEKGRQVLLQNKTLTSLILSKEQPPEFTEENLSTIFLLSESFLCITDARGTIQFFNPAFSRILGYTDDELLTKSFFSFFHAENKPLLETKLSKFEKPVPQNFESRYQCRDGAFRTIRWAAHRKYDRLYILGTDITELRYIEKEFLAAQQSSILSRLQESEAYGLRQTEFIAQLSHEVRNPLSGIYGLTEALKIQVNELEMLIKALYSLPSLPEQEKLDQTFMEIRETCMDMINCMEYQKAILNDNLDIVRITEKRLTLEAHVFELKKALCDVLKIFQAKAMQKGVALQTGLPEQKEVWVKGDSLRFKQIIINLVGNAIKFTESGGKIELILTLEERPVHQVGVKILVIDTGTGLTEEELGHLFQRFSQIKFSAGSHYEGSGLGLYLAKQLATLMQGDITVQSCKGKGSTFSLDMQFTRVSPREKTAFQKAQLPQPPLAPKKIHKTTVKRTVLIVEDNLINQKILVRLLKAKGYDSQVAADGIEALAAYDRFPVDIILMDIVMPRMDGLTATQEIRRREQEKGLPRIPIIAITANALARDREQGLAAGVDDYSIKPYKQVEIYQKIEALLHGKKLPTASKAVELHPLTAHYLHEPPSSPISTTSSTATSFSSSSPLPLMPSGRQSPPPLATTSGLSSDSFYSSSKKGCKKNIDTVVKPLSPPPSWYAPHAQFLPPAPRDEKVRALLGESHVMLDEAYPSSLSEHSDARKIYLSQLTEYQSHVDSLTQLEKEALNQLLTRLQQVVAQRSSKLPSAALG